MAKGDAEQAMREAGFRVSVFSFIQSDQPAGTVLSQDPAAGEEFRLGVGIRLGWRTELARSPSGRGPTRPQGMLRR